MSKIGRRKSVDAAVATPAAGIGPDVARRKLNGRDHEILYWSRERWEATPPHERPTDGFASRDGGYFLIRPVVPYESLEEIKRQLGIARPAHP